MLRNRPSDGSILALLRRKTTWIIIFVADTICFRQPWSLERFSKSQKPLKKFTSIFFATFIRERSMAFPFFPSRLSFRSSLTVWICRVLRGSSWSKSHHHLWLSRTSRARCHHDLWRIEPCRDFLGMHLCWRLEEVELDEPLLSFSKTHVARLTSWHRCLAMVKVYENVYQLLFQGRDLDKGN